MSDHHCPTGWHAVPSYVCYEKHGCSCDGCRTCYRDRWREKGRQVRGNDAQGVRLDATVTRVRIRVLCDDGWTLTSLAAMIGVRRQTLGEIANGHKEVASARVREGVARIWRESRREETT